MSTRPERPTLGAKYDRRRQEVVDQAAAVFAERGYAETSVQQLSEALGIAAGGIYHYFGGKQELLIAIATQVMDPLLDDARTLVAETRDDADPQELLRSVLHMWVAQVVARRDHMLVFQQQRHAVDTSPEWRDVRRTRKAFEQLVDGLLTRLGEEGVLRGDRRLVLATLLGAVNHTAQWYRPRGPLSPGAIADGYFALVVAPG